MRVTERMFKNDSLRSLKDAQDSVADATNKISSQKEVYYPSDDPLRFVTANRFRAVVASKEQYLRNISDAQRFIDDNEAAVNRVRDLLQSARILLVQGSNGTLTTGDTQAIAKDLRGSLESLIQFANASGVDGRYFGGTQNDQDPFEVVRDANGTVTDVLYRGNTTPRSRTISDGTSIDLNLIGSQFFQVDPDTARSTFTATYAGDALNQYATFQDATTGPATGWFNVQDQRVYFDTAQDSLLDIARRINSAAPEADATVQGSLVGTTTAASRTAASAATAGTVQVNGIDITLPAGATLDQVVTALNAVSNQTQVTASVETVAGGFALRLDGGVEITDTGNGRSNALMLLGATTGGSTPTNLTSRNAMAYSLQLAPDNPDQLLLDDAEAGTGTGPARFLQRLGLTDGSHNAPANIPAAAVQNDLSIFKVLVDAIANLENGQPGEIRTNRIGEMDRALENIYGASADIGAQSARLQNSKSREEEFVLQAKSVISDSEEVDLADAVIQLQQAQLRLQAALGAASNIPLQNLLSYL